MATKKASSKGKASTPGRVKVTKTLTKKAAGKKGKEKRD